MLLATLDAHWMQRCDDTVDLKYRARESEERFQQVFSGNLSTITFCRFDGTLVVANSQILIVSSFC